MKNTIKYSIAAVFIASLFAFTTIKSRTISSSTVAFTIKNAGLSVDGTLGNLKTTVFDFDIADLANSKIEATVDVSTINTGIDKRDEHLRNEDYFDVAKYPKITMKSTRFAMSKAGNAIGYFNLTIKNKTKAITIPIFTTEKDGKTTFTTKFTIDRLDYGVGTSSFILSDDVKVSITAVTD